MNVALLGASNNPSRYAYLALNMLRDHGHEVFPVHPSLQESSGVKVLPELRAIPAAIHTLTMYVGPQISTGLEAEILALRPKRVIFNPGSENPALAAALERAGIATITACTLVMLQAGHF